MALTLRLAGRQDAAGIAAIYDPVCLTTAISFETEAPGPDEMARRIQTVADERLPWLVCVDGDTVLGYAYARPYNARPAYQWTLEASIYVAEAARGKGVARALYTALFALITAQGYVSIAAGITLPNAASVGLHEHFGFEPYGHYTAAGYKYGAWHDIGYYRKALRPLEATPPELVPITAVVGTPTWEGAIAQGLACLPR